MSSLPPYPAQIAPLIEALGPDDTVTFLLAFGGAELSIGKSPTPRSRVVQLLGAEKAARLARVADRLPSRIPTQKKWIARHQAAKGLPVAEIARSLHVSDVTVRKYLAEPDPKQPSLFDL